MRPSHVDCDENAEAGEGLGFGIAAGVVRSLVEEAVRDLLLSPDLHIHSSGSR